MKRKRAVRVGSAGSEMGWTSSGDAPMRVGKMTCIRETPLAVLLEGKLRDGHVGEIWVPKSVLHSTCRLRKEGKSGMFICKTWWGEKTL